MKKQVKTIFLSLLMVFLSLLMLSCNYGIFDKHKPNKSVLTVSWSNKTYSSVNGDYQITYNIDVETDRSGYFIFTAAHYRDDEEKKYSFIFSSPDVEILPFGITGYQCAVDLLDLKDLGAYRIYVKSTVDSSFDQTFVINLTSNLKSIALDYQIQDEYIRDGLTYTNEMLSGTITQYTKQVTLAAGAVYDVTARDSNTNESVTVRTIYPTVNSDYIYFRATYDDHTEMVCMPQDKASSFISVKAGKTDISVGCNIILKDISTANVEEHYLTTESEKILSFTKNPDTNPDKAYEYNVVINSVTEPKEILYSIDAEIFDEDAFLDQDYYSPTINPNANWLSKSQFSYIYDNEVKFTVDTDGVLHTFSVIPLNDTTFRSSSSNLHAYLYAKYRNDDTYRWKWRIMVGGVMEGIQLMTYTNNDGEKPLTDDIELREGDETGWTFRGKYIPTTTDKTNTLWYISDSKTPYTFTDDNGVQFSVPAPAAEDSLSNKVLKFTGGTYGTKTIGNFTTYFYLEQQTQDGVAELWTNYNNIGEDCVLVCLNTDTYIYNCVAIKNHGDTTAVVKGTAIASDKSLIPTPRTYKNLKGKDVDTPYKDLTNDMTEQCYPYTLVNGYLSYRTFYMDVDSALEITLNSTFKIDNMYVTAGNSDANLVFGEIDTVTDNYEATIYLRTRYNMDNTEGKNISLSDGALLNVNINSKYKIILRIVIYDKTA